MKIEKFDLSELREESLNFLELGVPISIFFDENANVFLPELYLIERIDEETVKITPSDSLDDLNYIIHNFEKYPFTIMIQRVNELKATISTIKKFSATEPLFEFETVQNYFLYSYTLRGESIGDIFDQIVVIYEEIDRMWSDDDSIAIEYFLSNIE